MKIGDIEDRTAVMIVNIPESKTGVRRQFTVGKENEFPTLTLIRKYMTLRPPGTERFFLNYRETRCTTQPIGKNTFGKIPSKIAGFLGLVNPKLYTGHCLRRTSATALVNAGASMTTLKRHGGWRSTTVAEGYLADSIELKNKTARMLAIVPEDETASAASTSTSFSTIEAASTSTSFSNIEAASTSTSLSSIMSNNSKGAGNTFSGSFANCNFFLSRT